MAENAEISLDTLAFLLFLQFLRDYFFCGTFFRDIITH